jgi:hypothetical protein
MLLAERRGILAQPSEPPLPPTNLIGRLRGDSIAQADNSAVATWPGLAGGNATQGTAGNRPVYKTSGINGKPSVQFTRASAHNLVWAGIDPALTLFSWLFVFAQDAATPNGESHKLTGSTGVPDTNPYVTLTKTGTSAIAAILDNAGWGPHLTASPAFTTLTKQAILITFNKASAGSCVIYRSGVSVSTAATNLGDPWTSGQQTIIGGWPLRDSNYFNGQLAEVCKWSKVLDATERAAAFAYTLSRYGV